jgi:hypothetical protein
MVTFPRFMSFTKSTWVENEQKRGEEEKAKEEGGMCSRRAGETNKLAGFDTRARAVHASISTAETSSSFRLSSSSAMPIVERRFHKFMCGRS